MNLFTRLFGVSCRCCAQKMPRKEILVLFIGNEKLIVQAHKGDCRKQCLIKMGVTLASWDMLTW